MHWGVNMTPADTARP